MKILVVTASYNMLNDFANRFCEILKPIVHEKKNIIIITRTENLRGRVLGETKVIFLEDEYLLKELYDIKFELKRRGCEPLYFNSRCGDSQELKNYLLKTINHETSRI